MEIENRICKKHGTSVHYLVKGTKNSWKCRECNTERVTATRRNNKIKLIQMFGGKCSQCGYDRYAGALEFHHLDPEHKDFGIGSGKISFSLKRMIEEAKKCVLVCSNCHKEIHAGFIQASPNGRATSC